MKLYLDVPPESPTIRTFAELMEEICYSWGPYPQVQFRRESGVYLLHKLAIGKNWAQYKEQWYRLEPGVYEKLEQFYELLQE